MYYGVTALMKIWIGVFALLLISLWKGCTEISFSLSGEVTTGHIDELYVEVDRHDRPTGDFLIDYSFVAEDDVRLGRHRVDETAIQAYETGQEVAVIYVPGSPRTNAMVAFREPIWMWVILGMVTVVVACSVVLVIQAKRDVARDRRR